MNPLNPFNTVMYRLSVIFYLTAGLLLVPGMLHAQSDEENDRSRAMAEYIDGIVHFENGDIEQALDKLTAAHLILSSDAGISYALSVAYLANGDLTNAAYYGQMSTRIEPENKWYLLNMAEIYSRSGRQEMALNRLQDVYDLNPGDIPILHVLTGAYIDLGRLEEANDVLDRIIELTGSTFELHQKKFQNYNALRQDDQALAELEKMKELDPGNLLTLQRISRYYLELGQTTEAEQLLLDALERNPKNIRTIHFLAELYITQEKWHEMGSLYLGAIEDPGFPPSGKVELIRSLYMQHTLNPDASELTDYLDQSMDLIVSTESEYAPAQLFAAEYYLNQNDSENALRSLEKATAASPGNAEAWAQRFQILFSNQQYNEIISLSDTAEQHAPDNPYIRFFSGASYLLESDYEQAEQWLYQASLLSAPRDFRSVIYSSLADVRVENDKWEEAKEDYERAVRLNRDNHNALNNYAYYLSLQEEEEETLEQALDMAKRAIAMEPENPSYLDTLGWIYFKTGNTEMAEEYIQKALDAGAESADVYEHMGHIQYTAGNHPQAAYWWERALEMDPERSYLREKMDTD